MCHEECMGVSGTGMSLLEGGGGRNQGVSRKRYRTFVMKSGCVRRLFRKGVIHEE